MTPAPTESQESGIQQATLQQADESRRLYLCGDSLRLNLDDARRRSLKVSTGRRLLRTRCQHRGWLVAGLVRQRCIVYARSPCAVRCIVQQQDAATRSASMMPGGGPLALDRSAVALAHGQRQARANLATKRVQTGSVIERFAVHINDAAVLHDERDWRMAHVVV